MLFLSWLQIALSANVCESWLNINFEERDSSMETVEEYNYAKNRMIALDKSVLVEALLQLA